MNRNKSKNIKKKLFNGSLVAALAITMAPLNISTQSVKADTNGDIHVQLLGINDYHGQLDTWRSIKDSTGKVVDYSGGIEYLAAYLKEREATNPANTLMVQAGDLVGASPPVSALLQDEPTIRFMNELGFDVGTIGNHEFDEGVAEMKRLINGGSNPKTEKYEAKYGKFTGSTMDYVVANVVDDKNEPILPPYVVKEVGGAKIGFIGVVTTETPTIVSPKGVEGVKFTDEVAAINKYAKELTDKGVKSIVVLAHNPGSSQADGSNATGRVVDIANATDASVDVIFGAHDHKLLNAKVNGKLLVQSWSYGTAFSDVELTIDPATQDIVEAKAEIVDTLHSKITPDAKIKAELDGYKADIQPITSQVMGETADILTNAANASGESALGNFIADGMKATTSTDFAFMNAGGIRNPLPKGTITWGDLFKVQPFGNDLVTMKITGEQVRTLLNQQFNAPPSYNKIMAIAGLHYTWTDKNDYGKKILDIYLPDGSKIDPTKEYSITVNNFMADGGDGFTILKSGTNRVTSIVDLDGFVNYFKSFKGPVSSTVEGRVQLVEVTPATPVVGEVTNKSTKVTGKAFADALVKLQANGKVIGTTTASKEGNFTVEIPVQKAGTTINVIASDAKLNVSNAQVKVKDVIPPAKPVVNQVDDNDMKVSGKAEAGTTVTVKSGKTVVGIANANYKGTYTVTLTKTLKAGTTLSVTSVDKGGNTSPTVTTKVVDKTAPTAPVLVTKVTSTTTSLVGKAEVGSSVQLKVGKKVYKTISNKKGLFTFKISKQKSGTILYFTAKDKAGNVSKVTKVVVK
ncbi:Ig-like domain-containing protein [Gottfriedia solisilvae]|uniref:bifunctional metallophosphatase/5'-nucleotidase n=1 Tax=Gottfriedia solisilvae TaxID=1516104 RepID=UPI003D2ECE36